MTEKLVEFKDVNFGYGSQAVLENATFSINKGDFAGIIGPNGGGKTTLVKLMLGYMNSDSGKIMVFGKEPGNLEKLQKIGYVPQKATNFDQDFPATVYEVVSMGRFARAGMLRQLSEKDKKAIERAIEEVSIKELRDKKIGELSGGQQQRVFIARALASEPDMLILDEPLTGVDMESQHKFYSLLKHLNKKMGITLILISHDIGVISKSVTKMLCVNGKVNVHDTSKGVKKAHLSCAYSKDMDLLPHHHDEGCCHD